MNTTRNPGPAVYTVNMCKAMRIFMLWSMPLIGALATGVGAAVQPLTSAQKAQLEVADDGGAYDEASLYPLLQNVTQWDQSPPALDYEQLLNDPKAFRGDVFTIEGLFGRAAQTGELSRSGTWGDRLAWWAIRVEEGGWDGPTFMPDRNVVVFFANAQGLPAAPKMGTPVRLVGRFYKIWGTTSGGKPYRYPAFVSVPSAIESIGGKAFRPGATADSVSDSEAGRGFSVGTSLLLLLITALAVGYVLVRFVFLGSKKKAAGRDGSATAVGRPMNHAEYAEYKRRQREQEQQQQLAAAHTTGESDDSDEDPPLPEDPVQAMQELERRRETSSENQ